MESPFILFLLGKKSELLLVFTDNISGGSSAQIYWMLHTQSQVEQQPEAQIINKTRLVFSGAEAHMQTSETVCVGLLHLCTIQETDVCFTDRGTQQHFPLLLNDLFVTFFIANSSKQN